jgi:hypothetical protein
MAIAVKTVPASPRQGERVKHSHCVAGSACIAVLPAVTGRIWAALSAAPPSPRPHHH